MTITDSTISGNSVREYGIGGGIQNDGVLTLTNSTVTGNRVDYMGNGAGIYTDGLLTVTNSIVADNTIKNSPEEFGPPVEDDCVGPSCPPPPPSTPPANLGYWCQAGNATCTPRTILGPNTRRISWWEVRQ